VCDFHLSGLHCGPLLWLTWGFFNDFPDARAGQLGTREDSMKTTATDVVEGLKPREDIRAEGSDDKYATIVASAMDAIIVIDHNQRITVFNAAAEKMFRYAAAEVFGKSISLLMPSRFHEVHASHIKEFEQLGVTSRGMGNLKPLSAIRSDGEEFPIEASISQLKTSQGRLFTAIVRDITDRVRAEEKARHLSNDLEAANLTLREQMEQRRVAEISLLAAHRELKLHADEMEKRNVTKRLLSDMAEFLHSCTDSIEASKVASLQLETLFPDCGGVIYLTSEYGTVLETFSKWNTAKVVSPEAFEPHECWGLRRGRPHIIRNSDVRTKCAHLREANDLSSVCIPMMAQGQPIGMFHMCWSESASLRDTTSLSSIEAVAVSATETVAVAIANVRLREKLKDQTMRDPLTGLYNRGYLEDSLNREILRARRGNEVVGVIMIDVDNFKLFNDTYGHPAGDEVLRMLGAYLKTLVRPGDIPARYGGEEFTLIMPGASSAIVQARAERLRAGFCKIQAENRDTRFNGGSISLSCGVAIFPEHGESLQDLLQAADVALYQAKRAGKDQVVISADA
jgi:diguanylate cyclase (GGDEF)-like protein/PAS domain S-box-containing protein